jgi:4-carboxymuconolactone decarboxylase
MRLPLIPPAKLTPEQQPLYDDMRRGIEQNFKGFQAIAPTGELIGPWNPWLHFPKFGKPVWELVKALATAPSLPKAVREVAILVTGAHFRSAYEIYAHVLVAEAADCRTRRSRPLRPASARATSPARKRLLTTLPPRWSPAACFRN